MTKIKAIIFDNEWVIVKNDWERVSNLMSEYFDSPKISGSEFKKSLKVPITNDSNFLDNYARGRIDSTYFWSNIIFKVYKKVPNSESINFAKYAMSQLTDDIYQPIIDIIKQSKKSNYKILMLSNSNPDINRGNRERHDYFKYFDETFFSFEKDCRKPELEAYHNVLEKYNLNPNEAIFVDDKQENIDAANNLGIETIVFKIDTHDDKYLIKELNNFGVYLK